MSHSEGFVKVVDESKSKIREISIEETEKLFRQKNSGSFIDEPILIDTREDLEWQASRIPGSIHLGRGVIERDIEEEIPNKNAKIILYCGGGFRSALSAEMLQKMGYNNVFSMEGGIRGWREKKLPEDCFPEFRQKINAELLITPRSPFARRIRLFCKRNKLNVIEKEVNPFEPTADFLNLNPLGLVPVLKLISPEEETYFDSDTILDVLDSYGYTVWGNQEYSDLRKLKKFSRIGTGIMTAAVAYYLEKLKPHADTETMQEHEANILRSFQSLNSADIEWISSFDNQALWDLGVAIQYCDLRVPHLKCYLKFEPICNKILNACRTLDLNFEQSRPPV